MESKVDRKSQDPQVNAPAMDLSNPPPMSATAQQFSVMGMPVHLRDDYPGWLYDRLAQGQGTHVVTLNTEMIMQAETTPELAKVIHQAELVIPDGAGVVLYLRLYGVRIARHPGIELAEALLQRAAQTSPALSVFCFGGEPGVTEAAMANMQQRFPGLNVVGTEHGFHPPEAEAAMLERLAALQPQLILVGLGVPRQEYWIAQHRHLCPQAIWVGVGGSFDIWAGRKFRAPLWLRNHNLEWVYRLYKEPWRWRRMLALPRFAWRALLDRVAKKFRR
uniref:Glycosyl transferase, WecB/TagA/CpsF family n=1 Tax=Cyanothece sp. (strain PCC 7425 / ATCC 29141) TaxID=395961 RepID=B8HP15_CYAP4